MNQHHIALISRPVDFLNLNIRISRCCFRGRSVFFLLFLMNCRILKAQKCFFGIEMLDNLILQGVSQKVLHLFPAVGSSPCILLFQAENPGRECNDKNNADAAS